MLIYMNTISKCRNYLNIHHPVSQGHATASPITAGLACMHADLQAVKTVLAKQSTGAVGFSFHYISLSACTITITAVLGCPDSQALASGRASILSSVTPATYHVSLSACTITITAVLGCPDSQALASGRAACIAARLITYNCLPACSYNNHHSCPRLPWLPWLPWLAGACCR